MDFIHFNIFYCYLRTPYDVVWTRSPPFSNSIHNQLFIYHFSPNIEFPLTFSPCQSRLCCPQSLESGWPTKITLLRITDSLSPKSYQISIALQLMVRFYAPLPYFMLRFCLAWNVHRSHYAKTTTVGLYQQLPCCAWKTLLTWFYSYVHSLSIPSSTKIPGEWMHKETSCICPI